MRIAQVREEQRTLQQLSAALREHRPELDAASYLCAYSTTVASSPSPNHQL